MTRTTALREYELAADLLRTRDGALRREILETADGQSSVILVVDSADALDVLEVLRRAYKTGREDRAAEISIARNDVITIVPDRGAPRRVHVSHVERTLITLADEEQ